MLLFPKGSVELLHSDAIVVLQNPSTCFRGSTCEGMRTLFTLVALCTILSGASACQHGGKLRRNGEEWVRRLYEA